VIVIEKLRFSEWLTNNGYNERTISSRLSNIQRVEEFEGNLDYHFLDDEMKVILSRLTYGLKEESQSESPKHSIPINGNVRNGTATFKSAVNLYKRFKMNIFRDSFLNESESVEKKKFQPQELVNKRRIDSYQIMLDTFNISKDEFYRFGIENTIYPEYDLVVKSWMDLKARLFSNKTVYIRGAGRDAKGTPLFLEFYKILFNNSNIAKDSTNNLNPQKLIEQLTGLERNSDIYNYQVSHIYGRTKNPLMFEAAWNIAYVPKIIDPLTGHETKGIWPDEYQKKFTKYTNLKYEKLIVEYNGIIKSLKINETLQRYLNSLKSRGVDEKRINQFEKSIRREFTLIEIE
jgi:hypothetical protein